MDISILNQFKLDWYILIIMVLYNINTIVYQYICLSILIRLLLEKKYC